jgi:LuxR family maltose regulon positive regulatory protein
MSESAARTSDRRPDRAASPFLRVKLRRPVVPRHHVHRERLVRLLDEASTAPLTLVVAPAGAGKTVLVAAWAASTGHRTAWLSLDDGDRDGHQLWRVAIAALETLRPGCGDRALDLLRRRGSLTEVVGQLLADLDGDHPRSTLVVDDLHVIGDDAATASLRSFLEHLPPWLHVVALSRRDPALPIDRLRARGHLREVRLAELMFSRDEAHEMLSRLAPTLAEDELRATTEKVGGWAAGLQLTALAARSRSHMPHDAPVPGDLPGDLPGDDLLVDDYVWREVFDGEDQDLVEVLLDVAVVERVNAGLGRALTGRDDADRLLVEAEARGLFVTRLDPEGWFSVHALVRSVLLAELGRRSPERVTDRHVRAAHWFEDHDEVVPALEHWISAGRPRAALRLLAARVAELYDSGREATIRHTIARLPASLTGTDVDAMIELAWCHLLVSRRRFVELVDQAAWWAERSAPDEPRRVRLAVLRSIAATISGDWAEGGRLARRALHDLGAATWPNDPIGRFGWNMVARDIALSERWDDASDEVREADLALGPDPERHLALQGTRALGLVLAGRPTEALLVAAGIRRTAATSTLVILRGELALAEAMAHLELGERDRAVPELLALAEEPAEATAYCRVLAALQLAEAHLDVGETEDANGAFELARSLIETEISGHGARDWLVRTGSRLAVVEGRAGGADGAERQGETIEDPFWRGVVVARAALARGDMTAAVAALPVLAPRCVRHQVVVDLLRARTATDRHDATVHATAAAELASTHGLLRTVAAEGPDVVELIERSAASVPPQWLDRLRRAIAVGAGDGAAGGETFETFEPLTERERDVLRFLASRLTVKEIADELYVSVNTLKFHVKAIYRKLGVRTRAEAAEVARRMTTVRSRS